LDLKDLMNNEDFLNGLIQRIVAEVIKRLENRPKTALVCFSGAAIGFKEAMNSLAKLREDGWQLKVFMSDNSTKVLDPEYIKKTLGVDTIHTGETDTPQKELYDVDQIIIATTTINTAAKIACGIADNVMLTLINHGLMAGVPVVCAIDGACPDNALRHKLGMGKSPAGYRKVMVDNLKALRDFDMQLCAADDLYDVCAQTPAGAEEVAGEPVAEAAGEAAAPAAADRSEAETAAVSDVIASHIVSRKDVMERRAHKVIKVKADAIVTTFAIETANEYDIKLVRE
jgi:hypothetical protein